MVVKIYNERGIKGMARTSTLLVDLRKSLGDFEVNIENDEWMEEIPHSNIQKFLNCLSEVSDKRNQSYITYPIQEILFISFFAVLSNSNSWLEIGEFALRKKKWIGYFFDTEKGVPSHDTIQRAMTVIKPEELHTLMSSYIIKIIDEMEQLVEEIGDDKNKLIEVIEEKEILSVDGKVSRGSAREETKNGKVSPLNTLSVYSSKYCMSLLQEYIDEKTNEIPNTPKLLEKLDIKGTIVTWDALNT